MSTYNETARAAAAATARELFGADVPEWAQDDGDVVVPPAGAEHITAEEGRELVQSDHHPIGAPTDDGDAFVEAVLAHVREERPDISTVSRAILEDAIADVLEINTTRLTPRMVAALIDPAETPLGMRRASIAARQAARVGDAVSRAYYDAHPELPREGPHGVKTDEEYAEFVEHEARVWADHVLGGAQVPDGAVPFRLRKRVDEMVDAVEVNGDFSDDPPTASEAFGEPEPEPAPRPLAIAAAQRVLAALDLVDREACRARGAVVVMLLGDGWGDWHESFTRAWFQALHGVDQGRRRTYFERGEKGIPISSWLSSDSTRTSREDAVADLVTGVGESVGVVFVAQTREALPPEIASGADVIVEVPALTTDDLRIVARRVTGCDAGTPVRVADDLAARVRPAHLVVARRPGDDAQRFADRLAHVVAETERLERKPVATASRWTLDTLPLPAPVETWARRLVADFEEYRAGRLGWAEIDRGALVYGPPGSGKTTFAQALAASAGVAFFPTSYSAWEAGKDGKGSYTDVLRNMRRTFREAREAAPALIFIDEIDSLIARGSAAHNESWWRPIVNALLAELDGIGGREGVVVLAATNLPGMIDPAIRRAGRLDRELELGLPDAPTLARILRAHVGVEMDYGVAAQRLIGSSGADVERVSRGARRRARAAGRAPVLQDVLAEVRVDERPRSAESARWAAVHEAGHALIGSLLPEIELHHASIRSDATTDGAVGVTHDPGPGREQDFQAQLVFRLGGRAAEEICFGQGTAGCQADLAGATLLAARVEFGLGFRDLTWPGRVDEGTLPGLLMTSRGLHERVEARLRDALERACGLLRRHRAALDAIADALVAREALSGAEVAEIVAAYPPVADVVAIEAPRVPMVAVRGGVR